MIARVIAKRLAPIYSSEQIESRLAFLAAKEKALAEPKHKTVRTPHFCSGCPHNTSTKLPEGSRAQGGIGCHYMTQWMDRNTDTFTQMGGEGATWIGQAPSPTRRTSSRTSATAPTSTPANWPCAPPWPPGSTSPTRSSTTTPWP